MILQVVEGISSGKARKANGPIEHWLTTLATGFWGFDAQKESIWNGLKKGDLLVFQSTPPNIDFVKINKKTKTSGFIGVGVVEYISKKTEPRWLSEVIESRVQNKPSPMLWPNLVHFSDVFWFGDVMHIPRQKVQEMIEGCTDEKVDLEEHIAHLAKNHLSLNAMKEAGFTYAPMGTGGYLKKNSEILAQIFKAQIQLATHIQYGSVDVSANPSLADRQIEPEEFTYEGSSYPKKNKAKRDYVADIKGRYLSKKDYIQAAVNNHSVGLRGELLVLERERQRVRIEYGEEHVSKVVHVSLEEGDGAGYDIRSVRKFGSSLKPYYIEVKTTEGGVNTEFFISENELAFACEERLSYELVRIHSLDMVKKTYQDYTLTGGELMEIPRTVVSYRVNVGISKD